MLPTIPVTEPTHWVPATQPSLTSVLPLSRLQSQPDRFTSRITERIFWLHRVLLLPPPQCWQQAHQLQILPVTERVYRLQTGLLLPPSQCWQQAHRLQRKFSDYTDLLLPPSQCWQQANQLQRDLLLSPFQCWQQAHWLQRLPVTERIYRLERSAAPTIPVLTAGSLVTEVTGYRENLPVNRGYWLQRDLLPPPFQCWQQAHRLQRNQLFPWAEGNLRQQVQWGQQGHQLEICRWQSDRQEVLQ